MSLMNRKHPVRSRTQTRPGALSTRRRCRSCPVPVAAVPRPPAAAASVSAPCRARFAPGRRGVRLEARCYACRPWSPDRVCADRMRNSKAGDTRLISVLILPAIKEPACPAPNLPVSGAVFQFRFRRGRIRVTGRRGRARDAGARRAWPRGSPRAWRAGHRWPRRGRVGVADALDIFGQEVMAQMGMDGRVRFDGSEGAPGAASVPGFLQQFPLRGLEWASPRRRPCRRASPACRRRGRSGTARPSRSGPSGSVPRSSPSRRTRARGVSACALPRGGASSRSVPAAAPGRDRPRRRPASRGGPRVDARRRPFAGWRIVVHLYPVSSM